MENYAFFAKIYAKQRLLTIKPLLLILIVAIILSQPTS